MKKFGLLLMPLAAVSFLTNCNNSITITWVNDDGTVLEIDRDVQKDSYPQYNGVRPSKQADNTYYYVFTGWTPEFQKVTASKTYRATYRNVNIVDCAAYVRVVLDDHRALGVKFNFTAIDNVSVDWGDGCVDNQYEHNYLVPGEYDIKIKNVSSIAIDFRECGSCVNDICLNSQITSISDKAFELCTFLTSITIPNSVTSMEGGVIFRRCLKLSLVDLTYFTNPNVIPELGEDSFKYCSENLKFKVASEGMADAFIAKGGGWSTDKSSYIW